MKNVLIQYTHCDSWKELSQDVQNLVQKAYQVAENAYAPYSNFKVGAALQLDNGEIVLGSNQENAAFPSGICAERTALFYAGANFPNQQIKKIVIVAKGNFADPTKVLSPCGSCRQVMIESESRQREKIEVYLVNENEQTVKLNSTFDLLPFAFEASK